MGNNFIELNGKRYDALNGTLLGESQQAVHARPRPARQGRVIDGFVRPSQTSVSAPKVVSAKAIAPAPKAVATHVAAPVKTAKRTTAKTVTPHQPQRAQTLMRTVVSKPDITMKTKVKVQPPAEMAAKPVTDLVPKKSALHVDERRLARAQSAGQNRYVQRFTRAQQNHPVAQASAPAVSVPAVQVSKTPVPNNNSVSSADIAPAGRRRNTSYATRAAFAQRGAAAKRQAAPQPKHADVFEAALAQATSHEQPKHKYRSPHRKLISVLSVVGAFIILGGFITYLNVPNIELHVASLQAGFHAELPQFKPTGYALQGGIHANNGIVTVSYRSGDSSFSLQQQPSNWDSQTLLDNVVSLASGSHQTYQAQGRTVYIYGDSASWVNGGVLYSMKTGQLSNDEVTSIAASM